MSEIICIVIGMVIGAVACFVIIQCRQSIGPGVSNTLNDHFVADMERAIAEGKIKTIKKEDL